MKKIYLSLLLCTAIVSVKAQLTQANHAIAAGDTYQMYQCDSTGFVPGPGGANMVWTYSAIPTHTNLILSYTATTNTTGTFTNAQVAVSSSSTDASYYTSSATDLKYYGGNIAVSPVVAQITYTNAAITATYPMSFNSAANGAISGTINVIAPLPGSGNFVGTSSVTADATGTMMLPGINATFTNVLRVLTAQVINFTVNAFVTGTVTQMNYDYYTPGIKAPIFSVATATVGTSISSPSSQMTVRRNKSAVGTATLSDVGVRESLVYNELNLFVYPNPSNSEVNFATNSLVAKTILVYNVTGTLVDTLCVVNGKSNLNVSSYNKGFYIYTVLNDQGKNLKSGRFTVVD